LKSIASLCLIALTVSIHLTQPCVAQRSNSNKCALDTRCIAEISAPDRLLYCRGLDQIDIGVDEEQNSSGQSAEPGRRIKYFSRDQLRSFLMHEKHKDLLVVAFEKPLIWKGPEEVKRCSTAFQSFLKEFGYKRIVIIGSSAFSTWVLFDSSNASSTTTTAAEPANASN
jgi:hypothetical protein